MKSQTLGPEPLPEGSSGNVPYECELSPEGGFIGQPLRAMAEARQSGRSTTKALDLLRLDTRTAHSGAGVQHDLPRRTNDLERHGPPRRCKQIIALEFPTSPLKEWRRAEEWS